MHKTTPRSNMMWEGSRIILPEHREMLLERKRKLAQVKKPILDEQQQEEINRTIMEALTEGHTVRITYYQDGHIYDVTGKIHSWDMYTQTLHIVDEDGERQGIRFNNVLDVTG